MKNIIRLVITIGIFFILPNFSSAQTPPIKVPKSNDTYYGTKSNRTSNGSSTWNYYVHNRNDATWDTSPFNDFFFQRSWETVPMNFRFLYPQDFDSNEVEVKYPMIIMLHGLGEGGGRGLLSGSYTNYVPDQPNSNYNANFYLNNNNQLKNGGKVHLDAVYGPDSKGREFPGFVLFPQTTTWKDDRNGKFEGWQGTGNPISQLLALIEDIIKAYPIDANRIYIHGLSNGGNAVWKAVETRPDLFAAYLPMAGTPHPGINYSKISHIPLWLFQGADDNTNSALPTAARAAIATLEAIGATPRYNEFQETGHNAWDPAYAQPDFFSWMLKQSKAKIHVVGGKTEFCEEGSFTARLELDAHFGSYQWKKDGVLIPDANQYYYEAEEYGSYEASFLRPGSSNRQWSPPVVISKQAPTPPATIVANGSTTLPSLDGKTSVSFSVAEEYMAYDWRRDMSNIGDTKEIMIDQAGTYRISVTEDTGCPSVFSIPVVVTVDGSTTAVLPPTDFSAEPVSVNRINLFWKDNSENETGFEIYRATQTGGPYTFVTKTAHDVVYYADKNLAPSTTYYYILRAVNNIGSSVPTDEIAVGTKDDMEAPSIPQNLTASTNLDLTSIKLTWSSSHDNVAVSGYQIFMVNPDNSFTSIGTTTDTIFNVNGLAKETSYAFFVRASDASGKVSEKSNQVSAITIFCGLEYELYAEFIYNSVNEMGTGPNELKGISKMDNFSLYPGVDYYQNLNRDVTYFGLKYEGYIWLEAGQYDFNTRSDDGSTLSIEGTLVVSNDKRQSPTTVQGTFNAPETKAYRISVKYFNSGGGYEFGVNYRIHNSGSFQPIPNEMLCSTLGAPSPTTPNVPSNLIAEAVSEKQIDLSWTDNNSGETSFELYRRKSDGEYTLVRTLAPSTTTFADTALEASTTYYYKLRAVNATGESDFTDDEGKLTYAYYEGTWDNLPDFNAIFPVKTGNINNFDISIAPKADYFAFKFDGKILIETPGVYTFYTASDDGSQLYIEGVRVVQNDFLQGHTERGGTYTFDSPGTFDISVRYFEKDGGQSLDVKYQGPGIPKDFIPDNALNTGIVKATTLDDVTPPTAPTDLIVKSTGTSTVGLSWLPSTDNVDVVGYEIYNEQTDTIIARTDAYGSILIGEGGGSVNSLSEANAKSFVKKDLSNVKHSILSEVEAPLLRISTLVEGLTEGTDYYIYVKAIDASDNRSPESNTAHFTTNTQPLPIELVDFYGLAKEGFIEINWVTASEKNNDFFTLERSLDGKEFRHIGEVDGKGNSIELSYYTYEDHNPINGIQYYQLKQTDTNGVFEYSKIIRVSYDKGIGEFDLTVFPNPVSSFDFAVKLNSSNKESPVSISIFDMLGKEHYKTVVDAETLLNEMKISKTTLSAGIYIISVQQADKIIKKRIIVE